MDMYNIICVRYGSFSQLAGWLATVGRLYF